MPLRLTPLPQRQRSSQVGTISDPKRRARPLLALRGRREEPVTRRSRLPDAVARAKAAPRGRHVPVIAGTIMEISVGMTGVTIVGIALRGLRVLSTVVMTGVRMAGSVQPGPHIRVIAGMPVVTMVGAVPHSRNVTTTGTAAGDKRMTEGRLDTGMTRAPRPLTADRALDRGVLTVALRTRGGQKLHQSMMMSPALKSTAR